MTNRSLSHHLFQIKHSVTKLHSKYVIWLMVLHMYLSVLLFTPFKLTAEQSTRLSEICNFDSKNFRSFDAWEYTLDITHFSRVRCFVSDNKFILNYYSRTDTTEISRNYKPTHTVRKSFSTCGTQLACIPQLHRHCKMLGRPKEETAAPNLQIKQGGVTKTTNERK